MNNQECPLYRGWRFTANTTGARFAAVTGEKYVSAVKDAITGMEDAINSHQHRTIDIGHFQGFVAEEWGAGTFNINAAVSGAKSFAEVLHSNALGSVDVALKRNANDKGYIKNQAYSFKSYATAEKSANAQAIVQVNETDGIIKYEGQRRWVPTDQLHDAKIAAHRKALKEVENRPIVAKANAETEKLLTDVVEYKHIRSIPVSRKQLNAMAKKGSKETFSAQEFGIVWQQTVTAEYIVKEAAKAGCSSALLTSLMCIAPDVFQATRYLIKEKAIDTSKIKDIGIKGLTSGAESFLRGSVACSLKIFCEKGVFGESLIGVDPALLGTLVSIAMQTVTNTVLLILGKMTAKEFAYAVAESAAISAGFLAGAKIGRIVDEHIGWKLPIAQFVLSPAVGFAASVAFKAIKPCKCDDTDSSDNDLDCVAPVTC